MNDGSPTTDEPRYLTDAAGNRVAVLLGIDRYRELIDAWEEIDEIRAYDAAKASGDETVPLDDALAEIERERSRR